MAVRQPIAFNGKYLSAAPTGVHRVAHELIKAFADREAQRHHPARARVVAPPNLNRRPNYTDIPIEVGGRLTWQLWEQLSLPRLTRNELLVSLCNLAPLGSRHAITMIHDAQVFLTPESYSPSFVAWYRFALPRLGRRHARVLTVSEYSKSCLVAAGVATADRISVIPNGVDHIDAVAPDPGIVGRLGLDRRGFAIGLANLQVHKNIPTLYKAFADQRLAGTKLVLVGAATREEFAAQGHVAPDNAIFAGKVSDGELRALMEAALCVAFPSTTEGFGLPPLEGMHLGCPAVVAPCGALPEMCGDAAIYAPADDVGAWAAAISGLRDDQDRFTALSAAGRAQAKHFTWDGAAAMLEEVIAAVSAERVSLQPTVRLPV